jgi:hypothetical protein
MAKAHLFYYLRNFVWPFEMRALARFDTAAVSDPAVLAGALFICATLALAWRLRQRHPLASFAITATVIGVTIALPSVNAEAPPVLASASTGVAGQSRSERAMAALSAVAQFAQENRQDWDQVEERYTAIRKEFGDLLGDSWERSHVRVVRDFEREREEHLTEVLRSIAPLLRADDPVAAVQALRTYPVHERRESQGERWNAALSEALQRVRDTTGMAFVELPAKDGGAASPFLIDLTEVPNRDYARFVSETGGRAPSYWPDGVPAAGSEDLPVVGVTALEAEAFAKWKGGRLPTSAEW